jgi:hypothetical protein
VTRLQSNHSQPVDPLGNLRSSWTAKDTDHHATPCNNGQRRQKTWLPDSGKLKDKQSKIILVFFENAYISVRNVDRQTAERAQELVGELGMLPLDAIHLATAMIAKVPVLHTYDDAKGRRKGLLRHNGQVGTPPLRIEIPKLPSPCFLAVR